MNEFLQTTGIGQANALQGVDLTRLGNNWRLTPATLAMKISRGKWLPARHLLYISAKIAAALTKGNARLIVSMPPRHGKSELLSIHVPIWVWEAIDASLNIILASYGADLATDHGRKVRDKIMANPQLLRTRLRADKQQVDNFMTTEDGAMFSVGLGGAITGRGGDVILVDDYLKGFEAAESQGIRNKIWNGFAADIYSRMEPNASIIILATRWNVDDVIGRLLNQVEEDEGQVEIADEVWDYIRLPAIAEEGDPLGREVGEALWPARYPIERLNRIKVFQGTYKWSGLYQQAPLTTGAGLANESWFPRLDIMPHQSGLRFVRSWDLAATPDGGDYAVGTLCAMDQMSGLFIVCDVRRGQWSPQKVEENVKACAELDGRSVPVLIEQEPGSAGKSLISHFSRNVLRGYIVKSVRPSKATGSKLIRAQPYYAYAEAGNVRLKKAPWNRVFVDEHLLFPDGPTDDQVDTVGAAYTFLTESVFGAATWGRPTVAATSTIRSTGNVVSLGATFGRRT